MISFGPTGVCETMRAGRMFRMLLAFGGSRARLTSLAAMRSRRR
jgi:hypothetical protein